MEWSTNVRTRSDRHAHMSWIMSWLAKVLTSPNKRIMSGLQHAAQAQEWARARALGTAQIVRHQCQTGSMEWSVDVRTKE